MKVFIPSPNGIPCSRLELTLTMITEIGSGVVTVAVHPGIVKTDLGRHLSETSLFMNMFAKSADFFNVLKTAEMGAQTTIHCATDESIVNQNGLYFR